THGRAQGYSRSVELRDPLFGVGDALGVGGRGVDEPLHSVLIAAKREYRFGVTVEKPCGRLSGPVRIQLRGRQNREGLLVLSEIRAGAGHADARLVAVAPGELGCLGGARQLDRAFRAAYAAFAVGDQRKQRRLAAYAPGGAQFGQRLGPVAAVIGRDTDGLADRGDAAGSGAGGPGVCQRGLGVLVEGVAGGDATLW